MVLVLPLEMDNIHNMQNMSNSKLSPEQDRFIDDLASLLTSWSMPSNAGRLYGYLQLMNEPVTLDDIARDLRISKSNACTAAKVLDAYGIARRLGERGTKRVLYVAGDDLGAPLRRQTESLGRMAELILTRRGSVSSGPALERMVRLATFHKALQAAMEDVIQPEQQTKAA